jgi:hypothetical protein
MKDVKKMAAFKALEALMDGAYKYKHSVIDVLEAAYWQGKTDAFRIVMGELGDYFETAVMAVQGSSFLRKREQFEERVISLLRLEKKQARGTDPAEDLVFGLTVVAEEEKRKQKFRSLEQYYWQGKADGYRIARAIYWGDQSAESQVFTSGFISNDFNRETADRVYLLVDSAKKLVAE